MYPFQVFHNLKNKTDPNVFKCIENGSVVYFSFKADPNYGHLSGFHKKYKMVCTLKYQWGNLTHRPNHYKYNFLPIEDKKYKRTDITFLVPIADDTTGEIYTCEIKDNGYVSLEVRSKLCPYYYHPTNNSEVEIYFELTDEKLSESEFKEYKKTITLD